MNPRFVVSTHKCMTPMYFRLRLLDPIFRVQHAKTVVNLHDKLRSYCCVSSRRDLHELIFQLKSLEHKDQFLYPVAFLLLPFYFIFCHYQAYNCRQHTCAGCFENSILDTNLLKTINRAMHGEVQNYPIVHFKILKVKGHYKHGETMASKGIFFFNFFF